MKKIHFAFAGGAAVSAVAALAKAVGYQVSACEKLDPNGAFFTQLKKEDLTCYDEESTEHLKEVDTLVISAGTEKLDPENAEVDFAKKSGLPVLIAEEFLAKYLLKDKFVIAVSGTNGKSTTSAMIAKILVEAGFDPSVFVGALIPEWGTNWRAGKSKYFVIEADEYLDKFLLYEPYIEAITNIEFDHPDYFKDVEQLTKSYERFAARLKDNGKIFLGPMVTLETNKDKQELFEARKFNLKVPGDFNQQNASLAFVVSHYLEINTEVINRALEKFSGIGRRFEFKGEVKGVRVFDDYAHHPRGIEVTLEAAREKFPNEKIWCVYQPHTYSRLKAMLKDFIKVFEKAPVEELIFLPVFGSREEEGEIDSEGLVKMLKRKAKYFSTQEEAAIHLAKNANNRDVVLLMGAGDIVGLSSLLLKKLTNKS